MDSELAQRFFESYLDDNKLKYKVKDSIYVVKLDRDHKRWWDMAELKCTFDQRTAKEKNIQLMGVGSFIFDSMVSKYTSGLNLSNLSLPEHKQDLIELNDRLDELSKGSTSYMIEPVIGFGFYTMFEVVISGASQTDRFNVPLLFAQDQVFSAFGLERNKFEAVDMPLKDIDKDIEKAVEHLPIHLKAQLDEKEKEHDKAMNGLIRIQDEHVQSQYDELKQSEDNLQFKIDDAKNQVLDASSFSLKDKWNRKVKELERKLKLLVDKNNEKRRKIKDEFDAQQTTLDRRELSIDAKLLAYAKLEFPLFTVKYEDSDNYYYIPALRKFFPMIAEPKAPKNL
ncbi:hypothetical protein H6504_05760 [Candidatus Woesearchaeota archaeon]|nr:hypothetical protein [Candidatus Woesearchaeota archaeon]